MVERDGALSISRQCALLGVNRSSVYYRPRGERAENLALMRRMDALSLEYPFYGSRQMARLSTVIQISPNKWEIYTCHQQAIGISCPDTERTAAILRQPGTPIRRPGHRPKSHSRPTSSPRSIKYVGPLP